MQDVNGRPGTVFASAGQVFGSRYLDGRTQDGLVQAVGDTLPPFSGTLWNVANLPDGSVTIESLGDFKNPEHRFLDGHTHDGTVGMAPSTDPPFTGTRWRMTEVARTSLNVSTVERFQIRETDVRFVGVGFTPNSAIHLAVENHVPMDHRPRDVESNLTVTGPDGSFDVVARVDYIEGQPDNAPLVARATDDFGRTASEVTQAFTQF